MFVSGNLTASRLRYNDLGNTQDQDPFQAVGRDAVVGVFAEEGGGEGAEDGGDTEQQRRPSTAMPQQVMRILVRERTPSPIIDYELYATIIQVILKFDFRRCPSHVSTFLTTYICIFLSGCIEFVWRGFSSLFARSKHSSVDTIDSRSWYCSVGDSWCE